MRHGDKKKNSMENIICLKEIHRRTRAQRVVEYTNIIYGLYSNRSSRTPYANRLKVSERWRTDRPETQDCIIYIVTCNM